MDADQIRETFIDFMVRRGHRLIPSASLVPHGDPTLLFTSAGMVPFKPYFMGLAEPPASRMVTVQKCFRTTDIDEVGDYSHLTFFEMLGNFSIGDYFKREAIQWAWELLTEGFGLRGDSLWVSIYLDDDEAHDYWVETGVPEERVHRYDQAHNYWPPGDWDGVGPCGPNSEIFIDRGPRGTCSYCREGTCKPNLEPDCGRFIEVWNLVFMTLYQAEDGTRTELPRKNIDTGSGLERVTCVLQGKETVYETDLFAPIIARIEALTHKAYGESEATDVAMRIVAEHARAATFLITDGVMPSNDGRGYVLRRILRRAVYVLTQLSEAHEDTLLDKVASAVIDKMERAYPDLRDRAEFVTRLLRLEELKFRETTERGKHVLSRMIGYRREQQERLNAALPYLIDAGVDNLSSILESHGFVGGGHDLGAEVAAQILVDLLGAAVEAKNGEWLEEGAEAWASTLSGREVFILRDTFGFPIELTAEIAAKHGMSIDMPGYTERMQAQRERARAAAKFEYEADRLAAYTELADIRTKFVGYDRTEHETTVAGIIGASGVQDAAEFGDAVEIVLMETPFYAEGGGQVGDTGVIVGPDGRVAVEDTQAAAEGLIVHRGRVEHGRIAVNDAVRAQVDIEKRRASQRNHTATHLLHAALREVLGTHVRQAGSLVAPGRLRFDFTHIEATKPDELIAVQRLVNEKIRSDIDVHWEVQSYDEAIGGGAMALFGEKYAENVRVVGICEPALGDSKRQTTNSKGANRQQTTDSRGLDHEHSEMHCFSKELCGGTHVHRTGEIGTFVILSEGSVGSGVRRIEAATGAQADDYVIGLQTSVSAVARRLNTTPNQIDKRIAALEEELEAERKRVQQLSRQAGRAEVDTLLEGAERVDGASLIVARVPADSIEAMLEMGDLLRDKLGSAVVVLGSLVGEKPSFLAMVTKDLSGRVHAGNLIKQVAAVAGGSGGGRPDMAQAGGKSPEKLDDALGVARELARESLAAK